MAERCLGILYIIFAWCLTTIGFSFGHIYFAYKAGKIGFGLSAYFLPSSSPLSTLGLTTMNLEFVCTLSSGLANIGLDKTGQCCEFSVHMASCLYTWSLHLITQLHRKQNTQTTYWSGFASYKSAQPSFQHIIFCGSVWGVVSSLNCCFIIFSFHHFIPIFWSPQPKDIWLSQEMVSAFNYQFGITEIDQANCMRCPWELHAESFFSLFYFFFSPGYFSPRRGCPRILRGIIDYFFKKPNFSFPIWLNFANIGFMVCTRFQCKFQTGKSSRFETRPCLPYQGTRRHMCNSTPAWGSYCYYWTTDTGDLDHPTGIRTCNPWVNSIETLFFTTGFQCKTP